MNFLKGRVCITLPFFVFTGLNVYVLYKIHFLSNIHLTDCGMHVRNSRDR